MYVLYGSIFNVLESKIEQTLFTILLSYQYGRITKIPLMSGGVKLRVNIQLECTECKRRNYSTSKNKKNTTERLEINKYCKWDKKVTLHKETKK